MEQFFTDFFTAISPALQTLLQALALALIAQAVQYTRAKYLEAKASLSSEQKYILELVVSSAIRAAEQLYSDSAQKRKYAMDTAEVYLKAYGIVLDLDIIAAEVEAQVFNLKTIDG